MPNTAYVSSTETVDNPGNRQTNICLNICFHRQGARLQLSAVYRSSKISMEDSLSSATQARIMKCGAASNDYDAANVSVVFPF